MENNLEIKLDQAFSVFNSIAQFIQEPMVALTSSMKVMLPHMDSIADL